MRFTNTFFSKFSQVLNLLVLKITGGPEGGRFLESACSFYLGFIIGNLFGTFLNFLRNKIIWDGIILIIIIFFFEFLNFIIYNKNQLAPQASSIPKFLNKKLLIILKNFQIGILFGFFIDAFKVGS